MTTDADRITKLEVIADMTTTRLDDIQRGQESLRTEMNSHIATLRAEMRENNDSLRAEMRENNDSLRAEMRENNDSLRAEMRENNATLRAEMNGHIRTQYIVGLGVAATLLAAILAPHFM